jgi:hypothetical protein
MGVMNCSRKGCDNIMCDTYVSEVGYICNECKQEFENKYPGFESKRKLLKKLEKFMNEEKKYAEEITIRTYDFFKEFTK